MPDLSFFVESVAALPHAAAPHLDFKLRLAQGVSGQEERTPIQNVLLRCQFRIEPTRRRYGAAAQQRLRDLFGAPERWGQTLHSMLWTHVSVIVPPFTDTVAVHVPVPCSFDFNVAATKYFAGLADGEVPLCLLFSGSIFYHSETHGLQVVQIPWEKEARFRLPVKVWHEMMDHYYPGSAWLSLRKDVFDQLHDFKTRHNLPTWEQALSLLLASASEGVAP